MDKSRSDQEKFWADKYAEEYISKNSKFDGDLGAEAWNKMLSKRGGEIHSYLELGCNIGRNVAQLKIVIDSARPSIIEISKTAFQFVTARYEFEHAFNG